MLQDAAQKYDPFPKLHLPNRQWPDRTLACPPRWLATDLRDGNQALPEPMAGDAKLRYFHKLVELGYKEIEVSYPSASQTEFDFTRHLASTPGLIPDDVWIQVMAPFREDLIRTTVESARGAKQVIVHLHVSTSECFRRVVFNKTEDEMVELVERCTLLLRQLTKDSADEEIRRTRWIYEFTAENFQDTTVEYAVRICEAAKKVWEPTTTDKIIFNLPSTVEVAMPNVFADQIEKFCNDISEREKVCVSLHTHNDRGSAVAAAELGLLAGADRVEGCLFGNGERTGNVDLVTLAMNFYTQGVSPGIDFGDINTIVAMVEELTRVPVHWRAPYAGKFTFCTFTGVHQDAISKAYQDRKRKEEGDKVLKWNMPYLAMDPEDLGRNHEAIIRVNSQSGKRGVAWLVREAFGISMPLKLEAAFTRIVQDHATRTGRELTIGMIQELFESKFMLRSADNEPSVRSCTGNNDNNSERTASSDGEETDRSSDAWRTTSSSGYTTPEDISRKPSETSGHTCETESMKYSTNSLSSPPNGASHPDPSVPEQTESLHATVVMEGAEHKIQRSGSDFNSCALDAARDLGFDFECLDHSMQIVDDAITQRRDSASIVTLAGGDGSISWGVGIHQDPAWASLQAVLKASSGLAKSTE